MTEELDDARGREDCTQQARGLVGKGLVLGTGLGIVFGGALGAPGLGLVFGAALGLVFGPALLRMMRR